MISPTTRSRRPKESRWRKRSPRTTRSNRRSPPRGHARAPRPCVVALGGNVGPTEQVFRQALRDLEALLGPLRVAPIFRTEPVSAIAQRDFLNTVVLGATALAAEPLLAELQLIEARHGRRREREARGAPRTLDLDLLLLGDLTRRRRAPLLPHPRLRERRFVLAPLAALLPDLALPPDGATPAELLARLPARPRVERLAPAEPGPDAPA